MDSSNRRPLLQQSSDDDVSDLDFVVKSQKADPISTSSSSRSISSASTVTARKLSKDSSIQEIDKEDEDDDEEGTTRRIDVNAAKELLRSENSPKDRFGFNYIVFYFLGMTTMVPWNFFITAEDVSVCYCFTVNQIGLYLFYKKYGSNDSELLFTQIRMLQVQCIRTDNNRTYNTLLSMVHIMNHVRFEDVPTSHQYVCIIKQSQFALNDATQLVMIMLEYK